MSVSWSVLPLDPNLPGLVDWLQEEGMDVPGSVSRYPTLEELLNTLKIFDGQPTEKQHIVDDLWEVIVGKLFSDNYAHMLGSIEQNGLYHFHFWGSGCRDITMLSILKQLSVICGPLIWYDDFAAIPLLVTPEISVDTALAEWNQRWKERNPELPINKNEF